MAAVLLTVGCGGGKRKTARISGTVTFKGQSVPAGFITFMPDVTGGNHGELKSFPIKDGAFDTADGPSPGVYPGANVIRIAGFDGKPVKYFPQGKQIFNAVELKESVADGGTKDFVVPATAGANVRIEPTSDVE